MRTIQFWIQAAHGSLCVAALCVCCLTTQTGLAQANRKPAKVLSPPAETTEEQRKLLQAAGKASLLGIYSSTRETMAAAVKAMPEFFPVIEVGKRGMPKWNSVALNTHKIGFNGVRFKAPSGTKPLDLYLAFNYTREVSSFDWGVLPLDSPIKDRQSQPTYYWNGLELTDHTFAGDQTIIFSCIDGSFEPGQEYLIEFNLTLANVWPAEIAVVLVPTGDPLPAQVLGPAGDMLGLKPTSPYVAIEIGADKEFQRQFSKSPKLLATPDGRGYSLLHCAVVASNQALVERFIRLRADVNARDNRGFTPLHLAAARNRLEIIRALLDGKADVDGMAKNFPPLMSAVERGHDAAAVELLKAGANWKIDEPDSCHVIQQACIHNMPETVRFLLEAKCSPNLKKKVFLIPPLSLAAGRGYDPIVKLLLAAGADVNVPPIGNSGNALEHAALRGHYSTAMLLIEANAKVYDDSLRVRQPIIEAASGGSLPLIQELVKRGAKLSARDEDENSPLICAADVSAEAVKWLLEQGAKTNETNKFGDQPLHLAAGAGNLEAVKVLLAAGADVKVAGRDQVTPLHHAVSAGHQEMVEILFAAGAVPNGQSVTGWTPLHSASALGHAEIVKLLLARGSDRSIKTKKGELAIDLARKKNFADIVTLLEQGK